MDLVPINHPWVDESEVTCDQVPLRAHEGRVLPQAVLIGGVLAGRAFDWSDERLYGSEPESGRA